MVERQKEMKTLLTRVKEEREKASLKLNIQKKKKKKTTRIMASGPTTSMQIEAEIVETVTDFISWAPKSLCLVAPPCRTLCQLTAMASQVPLFTGILQARIVVWIAIPSSRGASQSRG